MKRREKRAKKSADCANDTDRILWLRVQQAYKRKQKGNLRPSAEELSQFLDHTADENARKKTFSWLAKDEEAVEELLVFKEPLTKESCIDKAHLNMAESQARSLVTATLKKHEETRPRPLRDIILDFIYFRNWVATAFVVCLLIISSAFAFRLGISTFQNRRQAETVLINELTFGLSETLTPQNVFYKTPSAHGGL